MPTDAAALLALAERVEGLEGPSAEINGLVWQTLAPDLAEKECGFRGLMYAGNLYTPKAKREFIAQQRAFRAPNYTASVDAALRLVGPDQMLFFGHLAPTDMRYSATLTPIGNVGVTEWRAIAATPACALLAAILRARATGGE